ncbi:MAG: hypothetical protein M3Q07_15675 [Pseudobdellovibrionaceae bacterium]|nr:hypothetical protein [Pseudobdellovibrionaceae bacterium]
MKCLLRVRWVALMLGLALSAGGCENKILSSKPESTKISSTSPTVDKSSTEAEPSEEVSAPANISGSYLVCRPLEAYQVEAASVGCRLSQLADGSKDLTIRSEDLQWKITNAGSSPVDAQIHRQVQTSTWHITVSIRAATADEWAQKVKHFRLNVRNPDNTQIADESLQKAIDLDRLIHSNDRPLTDPRLEQVPEGLMLSWQVAPTVNVLIVRWSDASPLSQAPQNKSTYSVGTLLGNGEVVFNGSAASWLDQTVVTGAAYSYQLWAYNSQALIYNNPEQLHLVRSCVELKARFPQVTTRDHVIDADGYGNQPGFRAFCDMDFDGGGWTLVLNYAHARSTNPP